MKAYELTSGALIDVGTDNEIVEATVTLVYRASRYTYVGTLEFGYAFAIPNDADIEIRNM